jgi:hypothetical protein
MRCVQIFQLISVPLKLYSWIRLNLYLIQFIITFNMLLKSARTLQNRVKLGKSFGWGISTSHSGIFSKAPEAKPESLTVPETSSVPIPEPSALIEPISFVNPRIELMKTQFEQFNGYLVALANAARSLRRGQPNSGLPAQPVHRSAFSDLETLLSEPLCALPQPRRVLPRSHHVPGRERRLWLRLLDPCPLAGDQGFLRADPSHGGRCPLTQQVQGIKTKLLSAEMKEFQDKMKKLSRSGEYGAIKEEREKFNALRRSHGISTSIQLLTLTQIPFLMTWFLSLRYMLGNADLFPALETGSRSSPQTGSSGSRI